MTTRILTDAQWTRLVPLVPGPPAHPGRPRHDDRRNIDGILWRALPPKFGPWQTVYARFRLWQREGTWSSLLQPLQRTADVPCIDATRIRAHQHAAGGNKGRSLPRAQPRWIRQ